MEREAEWEFEMGQLVRLEKSDEEGHVLGRAQYTNSSNSYYVRYRAGDGRQCEAWWNADALKAT